MAIVGSPEQVTRECTVRLEQTTTILPGLQRALLFGDSWCACSVNASVHPGRFEAKNSVSGQKKYTVWTSTNAFKASLMIVRPCVEYGLPRPPTVRLWEFLDALHKKFQGRHDQ